MEGIINLEDVFEEEDVLEVKRYEFPRVGITLDIQTMRMHVGVSRSVWKASLVLAQELETLSAPRILELGSGTGLGGIFAKKLYPKSEIHMSDICLKSIASIEANLKLNSAEATVHQLQGGNFEGQFAYAKKRAFELVIASDVVYLPECLLPLL